MNKYRVRNCRFLIYYFVFNIAYNCLHFLYILLVLPFGTDRIARFICKSAKSHAYPIHMDNSKVQKKKKILIQIKKPKVNTDKEP